MNDVSFIQLIALASLLLFFLLQTWLPRRSLVSSGVQRVFHNVSLFALNSIILRVLIPLTLVSISLSAINQGFGVFNLIELPKWLTISVCVVLLDLSIYVQHRATHYFPLLWRMHKVHHADTDMDVTTAVRFHPLELILSLGYKSAVIVLLGAPVSAVLLFELLLFIGPAFNHSNIKLPASLDRILRWVIVTPDTHRTHHSINVKEQNTNYGFFLIWWDKLFMTYTDVPIGGHQTMAIGLIGDHHQCDRIEQMLMAPFR
ncbi:MAG: sterol desaturase/sphingolipid hydroxylase (fatty acid hydroxylase superfamily) [Arenicella sp.]|jgi:sterol desaturase/sphingolipid hydroxylase (fatty acid hydroxylase superfamily)